MIRTYVSRRSEIYSFMPLTTWLLHNLHCLRYSAKPCLNTHNLPPFSWLISTDRIRLTALLWNYPVVCHLFIPCFKVPDSKKNGTYENRTHINRFRVSDSYSHTYYKPFFSFHDSSYFKFLKLLRTILNFGQSPVVQDCVLTITLDGQNI